MSSVRVVPYDPEWIDQFSSIRAELETALGGVPVVGIEHVGSTSVPGLAAKPVIDVDVVVDRAHFQAAIDALVAAGYSHRGDLGVEDRHSMAEPGGIRRNVYVVVDGSLALRNHLAVRDTLRSDPVLRTRYAQRKVELAQEEWETTDAYAVAKSDIIQEILNAAGLSRSERAAIQAVNQEPRPS
jgi:GrpB-like predicted nucleotidyltransferase (UPF0157 family)